MKRTLALILAALLLASSAASCGQTNEPQANPSETKAAEETTAIETDAKETAVQETAALETETPETAAPEIPFDSALITENGIAKAHIVLFDNASSYEKTAASELTNHIKLVTGADITVTNAAQDDSLPIIIATPDTLPELETLFPEDLAWLRVIEEDNGKGNTRYWSPDGFSIRTHDGKIYIFGATGRGAMNGVYEFIEENMDVIWIGSTDADIIYKEIPTVTLTKANYKEKSPFSIVTGGLIAQRNKAVSAYTRTGAEHNSKSNVIYSPIYDPNITEYWETDITGKPLNGGTTKANSMSAPGESLQVNIWSTLTADTIAATVLANLDKAAANGTLPDYYSVGPEDEPAPTVVPAMNEPYEYAPGEFVYPNDTDYLTTIYFSFYNRIARAVAEKYPTVTLNVLTFTWAETPPRCGVEPNISLWYCPYMDDYNIDSYEIALELEKEEGYASTAVHFAKVLNDWEEKYPDTPIIIYNYYYCNQTQGWYERPLWYKVQNDLQFYADMGVVGTTACFVASQGNTGTYWTWEGIGSFTHDEGFRMNILSYWLYYKLLWNPYENVDELIVEFCDKVYGDASEYMQEYYRILQAGWDEGSEFIRTEFNAVVGWDREPQYYYDYFLDVDLEGDGYVLDALKDALTKAYEAADDKAKAFISRPYEVFQDWENNYLK